MTEISLETQTAKVVQGHPFFEIIEEAYRVFSYDKPKSIEVCEGCCMDSAIEADFFRPSIESLPVSYVKDWYSAACDPKGITKETWAYLLPRILEILATDNDVSHLAIEISLDRFDTGCSSNWSSDEWSVLDRFQRMFLARQIEPSEHRLDDIACMFKLGGWPLASLFDQIFSASDIKLASRFWHDWCFQRVPGRENISITTFWEDDDQSRVLDLYSSPQLYQRMTALTLDDSSDQELVVKAAAVARVIESRASWLP